MSNPLERIADFDLTEEQRLVRATVREFGEKELLPYVEQYEREERYPLEQIRKLPALGLMGPLIPEQYGGSKSDVVTYGIICEELARADWVVASVVSVSNSLVAGSILRWGSEAQKQRWLPAIAAGDCICTACLTGEYPVPIPADLSKGVLEDDGHRVVKQAGEGPMGEAARLPGHA